MDADEPMARFLEHLGELGFEIEERGDAVWLCTHSHYPTTFLVSGQGGFLLRTYFQGIQPPLGEAPESLLNRVNRQAVVVRCFLDDDEDVVLEAWHSHVYDAEGFRTFLDLWSRDIAMLITAADAATRTFDA